MSRPKENDKTLFHGARCSAARGDRSGVMLGSRAFAEEVLQGRRASSAHDGPRAHRHGRAGVEAAARFYSSVFNPDMQKEKDPPLRYYVMTGTGYIALGSRANVTRVESRSLLHAGSRLRPRAHERHAREERNVAGGRGVVPDPDGIGLQLIAVPGGPGPTAVPGGRLVEVAPLVSPIGFDSILLKVADVRRSSDFYSHFFNTARAPEKGQVAFQAADTQIVLRPVGTGESPGVERYTMRVAAFDRAKVREGPRRTGRGP